MSGIAEVAAPSSFDSYEGIRIVIPGLIVFAVGLATFETLAPGETIGMLREPLGALVGALAVGLFLYFWDIPARSASYTEGQPTEFLEDKYPGVNPSALLTAYLLALNTKMPLNTRNRSLYMGSMFRIGVEMILALGLASTVVFGASVLGYGAADNVQSHSHRTAAAVAVATAFGLGIIVNQGYERRNAERSREARNRTWKGVLRDLKRKSTLLYAAGLGLVVLPVVKCASATYDDRRLVVVGLVVTAGFWAFSYVRGLPTEKANRRRRRRLHSVTSGLLLAVPIVSTLVLYEAAGSDILGRGSALTAWTAVACLVTFSVVVRGHERKLHGVYKSQTRWLEENPESMRDLLPAEK